ncbi:unnamed protein product [Symbiodinium sp. CCMP2592]|nr:unnamed protein product [Symbiodinium sp. CCMP2592]
MASYGIRFAGVADFLLEWLLPGECVRTLLTSSQPPEGVVRCCSDFAATRARVFAALNSLLQCGMLCPRMPDVQPVDVYVNALQRSVFQWLETDWNVSAMVPANLEADARRAGVNLPDLLHLLNRRFLEDIGESLDFLRRHNVAIHLFADAVPHVLRDPFSWMVPARFGGELATIFVVEMQVEALHFYVVCHELDVSWPRSSDSEEQEEELVWDISESPSPSSFAREAANAGPFLVADSD